MLTSLEFVDADREYDARVQQLAVDLDRLIRRLRSLTRHSWQPRRGDVLTLVERLAELSAGAEHRVAQALPALSDHSLVDIVSVLSDDLLDALEAKKSPDVLSDSEAAVRETWASTR